MVTTRGLAARLVIWGVAASALGLGCQGQGAGSGSAARDAARGPADATVITLDGPDVAGDGGEPDARTRPLDPDPEPPDPGRVIADLGAIPAWQAVVDRAQLLGRRGQHGVVYGRVGSPVMIPVLPAPPPPVPARPPAATPAVPRDAGAVIDAGTAARDAGAAIDSGASDAGAIVDAGPGPVATPYVWLIDDTEGNGSLAIRIALGDKAKLGDRIAAGGAWQLDEQRRWYWKPDTVQPLPAAPVSELKEPQPAVPGHAIVNGDLASGSRTMSVARDGDLVYFQIVGPAPTGDGDGWQVADQLGSPTIAVMNLPGERPSYGGQDMRSADERWQLKRGQTYWVRIGKLRKRGLDKPPLVNARTAPVRVL